MQFSTLASMLLLAIPALVSAAPITGAPSAIFARGKAHKALEAFINEFPDSKLSGLPTQGGKIYTDTDFRLDMQEMTSDKLPKHNLQIQVNKGTKISTLKKVAPKTVAGPVLAATGESASTIKSALLAKMLL